MPMTQSYSNELRKFNNDYRINFSIEEQQKTAKKIQYLDQFFLGNGPSANPEFRMYAHTLASALHTYMDSKTKMADGKTYDMSDISIGEFIERFENLMNEKYLSDQGAGNISPRSKFEGESFRTIVNLAWESIKRFDKPLAQVWADKIIDDSLSVDKMREITDAADEKLTDADPDNLGENRKDLANIIMAKEAMERVSQKRDFWWKLAPWHWVSWYKESQYLNDLKEKIDSYTERDFPLEDVAEDNANSVLEGVADKLKATYEKYKSEKPQKKQQETQNDKEKINSDNKELNKATVSKAISREEAERRINDGAVTEEVNEQIKNVICGNNKKVPAFIYKTIANTIYAIAINHINEMWDAAKNADTDKKEIQIERGAKNLCGELLTSMGQLEDNLTPKERLVAAQKITDLMLKTYSPIMSNNKYEKYGDNYFVRTVDHKAVFDDGEFCDPDKTEEFIKEVKLELGIEKKISLNLQNELSENQNVNETSSVIEEHNVPTKNIELDNL